MYKFWENHKKKILSFLLFISITTSVLIPIVGSTDQYDDMNEWYRPNDQSIFTSAYGNNHDCIIFKNTSWDNDYYLIISREASVLNDCDLWRTNTFGWSSTDWTLVDDNFVINGIYEYDDGVQVDGKYYIYESGIVYTWSGGTLEGADGNWVSEGTYPEADCGDIGVWYDDPDDGGDGLFHIFGEHGSFNPPATTDGSELSHYTSKTGLGGWVLVDDNAVEPNPGVPDGLGTYGVGDATITKIDNTYYLFCDMETTESAYNITMWVSNDINGSFTWVNTPITNRWDQVNDWDNHRVQDGELVFVDELNTYAMFMNWRDNDGNPGDFGGGWTRVIGAFYSNYSGSSKPQFISIDGGVNGTNVNDGTPTFNWTKVTDASQYRLVIDNNNDFSSPEVNLSEINQWNYPSNCDINATRISFTLPNSYKLSKEYYYTKVDAYV